MSKFLSIVTKLIGTGVSVAVITAILTSFITMPIWESMFVEDSHTINEQTIEADPNVYLDTMVKLQDGIIVPEMQTPEEYLQEKEEEALKAQEPVPEYIEYIVKIKDKSFADIAKKVYGDPSLADHIQNNNPKRKVFAGNVLKMYPTETIDVWALQETITSLPDGNDPHTGTPSPDVGNNQNVEAMSIENAIAYIKNAQTDVDTSRFKFYANARVTGYDPHCKHCCGKTNGLTGSGRPAEFGISVGASYDLPKGTLIYAEGYGFYRVDDRGAKKKSDIMIDIACPSHEVCRFMTGRANLYIVDEADWAGYPSEST